MGDNLVVAVSTDNFNQLKGKRTIIPFKDRCAILAACKYVDLVIPEDSWEQKKSDILKYNADIFVMGSDWAGKFDYLSDVCKVMYLPRTEGISTTEVKQLASSILGEKVSLLNNQIDELKKTALSLL